MKSIFELLGFLFTALITGVLAFLYIGHTKNAPKTEKASISTFNNDGIEYENERASFATVPSAPRRIEQEIASVTLSTPARMSVAKTPEKSKKSIVLEEKSTIVKEFAADKLKKIYEDEAFVTTAIEKWRKKVADVSKENNIRPAYLLANCIAKSYLNTYSIKDFSNDVAQHISDAEEPANDAIKFYDNYNCLLRLVKLYDLESMFPKAAKPMVVSKKDKKKEKKPQEISLKKVLKMSEPTLTPKLVTSKENASEKSFREMVARQEGFETWQGLQFLADPETKRNAEKRVKLLASAASVK
jgi:hypothetical protein